MTHSANATPTATNVTIAPSDGDDRLTPGTSYEVSVRANNTENPQRVVGGRHREDELYGNRRYRSFDDRPSGEQKPRRNSARRAPLIGPWPRTLGRGGPSEERSGPWTETATGGPTGLSLRPRATPRARMSRPSLTSTSRPGRS